MKILVLSHLYPNPMFPIYGVFVQEQVESLINAGCEVKVVSPTGYTPFPINKISKKWQKISQIPYHKKIDGVDVFYPRFVKLPKRILKHKSGYFLYKAIKKTIDNIYKDFKFDLIHAHVAIPNGFCGMLLKEDYNVPVVTTIHGADIYQIVNYNKKCRVAVETVLNNCDKVITVSQKLNDLIKPYIKNNEKLAVIENGFNLKKVYHGDSVLKQKYSGQFIILSVGYFVERKAHKYVINAISSIIDKYPNIKYLLIGEGTLKEELYKIVKDNNLENNIEFLGTMENYKVMEYMSLCDVFALPSWDEAFGVVYAEAMAHAKPVIAGRGEGIDGIVKNQDNGFLVTPKSSEEIKEVLIQLIEDNKFGEKIGKNAQKTIKKYTWDYNANRNIEIYKKLLQKRK